MNRRAGAGPSVHDRLASRVRPLAQRVGPAPLRPRTGGRIAGAVESLRAWTTDSPGTAYQAVQPPHTHERRPARSLTSAGGQRLTALGRYDVPEAFWAVVPGARIVHVPAPVVLTEDRLLLWESAYEHLRLPVVPRRRLHPPVRLRGRYMLLLNQFWENHFHWMADTLPKVALLPLASEPDTPVLVPAGLSRTQIASLAALGLAPERLVPIDHPHTHVDELVVPSFAGRPGYPPPWAVAWLRDRLVTDPATTGRRLWISRARAPRGRVANESAVRATLQRYGFESVLAETLSLHDQLRLYSEAELIVAAHGSGLTNIFASRDATVVELQSPRWWGQGCYYALADAAGLDYWHLHCVPTRWEHLHVDLVALCATIDAALGTRDTARDD